MQTLVYHFHKIVCHCHWNQRQGIILALILIVLAFLAITKQRRGLEMWPHCAQQPEYTVHLYGKYTESLPELWPCLHILDKQQWSSLIPDLPEKQKGLVNGAGQVCTTEC